VNGPGTPLLRPDRYETAPSRRSGSTGPAPTTSRHIVGLVVGDAGPELELAIVVNVFGSNHIAALHDSDMSRWYELRVCATERGTVPLRSSFSLTATHGLDGLADARTVILTSEVDLAPPQARVLHDTLKRVHSRGGRIVALGAGVAALAATGLLPSDGATTHWAVAEELRHRHPGLQLDASALYVQTDRIVTAAGAAATLDLCLELVRQDHGAAAAGAVARRVLAPPHRAGHALQSADPIPAAGDGLGELLEWASERLDQPLSLADLAQAANMSSRTLARRFHSSLGSTPLQWLHTQRIRLAQELLEKTDHPIAHIAGLTGLGSPANLRKLFVQATGMSPREYRRGFRDVQRAPDEHHGP
jgi:transcriptional regulator GlxA family with amidase domain